ncbi:hypothetical protein QJS10_CPA10g01811 [Acorus calamus]|uniref:Uncharacterized protein n=1 Tax=Acorus calamus TaxID=4465 RepID=A0AAV9E0B5_ACOCL|nr:hypothetical protein QJS10_CPA10g01811 [Acorus calamus]
MVEPEIAFAAPLNPYTDGGIEELAVRHELYGEEEERHLDNNKEDDSKLEEHFESEDGDCDGVFDEHTVEENEDQQKQDPLDEVGEQHSGSYSDDPKQMRNLPEPPSPHEPSPQATPLTPKETVKNDKLDKL